MNKPNTTNMFTAQQDLLLKASICDDLMNAFLAGSTDEPDVMLAGLALRLRDEGLLSHRLTEAFCGRLTQHTPTHSAVIANTCSDFATESLSAG